MTTDVMRQSYRELTDAEKQQMADVKAAGAQMWAMLDAIGQSRELSLAKTKVEESVMWAVKHVTG